MTKAEIERVRNILVDKNSAKFALYYSYGFNILQIKELFEYQKRHVMYSIRSKYIVPDMTVAQIREVMLGIDSDHIKDMDDVRIYAHKKYNHNFMRIVRVLLEWDISAIMLKILLNKGEFTSKEFFVLALITHTDKQDIDANIRFIKKCKDQVKDLYNVYRPIFKLRNKYTLKQIIDSFDHDLYLAKIEYLATHDDKRI